MARRLTRIFEGMEEDTSLIGFSRSCTSAPDHELFQVFMQDNEYAVVMDAEVNSGPSVRYVETRPPLAESHVQELGRLCARIIDPYHDGTLVIDNRPLTPPEVNIHEDLGVVIAEYC